MGVRPTVLSLCTGYGGLELGLRAAGLNPRVVCYVEREAFAAANLVAAIQAEAMDPAPIWTDLRTFDARPLAGVDLLLAGIPCQPWSAAGKREGVDDERWIWADVARIISECRPRAVFIECTPGVRKGGLPIMLQSLAAQGYDAAWACDLTAAEAGAPHRRTRFFMVAWDVSHPDGIPVWFQPERDQREGRRDGASECGDTEPRHVGAEVADPGSVGQSKLRATHNDDRGDAPRHQPDGCDEGMGHADRAGPSQHACECGDAREEHAPAIRAGGRMAWPPGPDDTEGWRAYLAAGGPPPSVLGGPHGPADRVDRVRLAGNGVVPAQASLAWKLLAPQ
jgi:DNA (cytosine-5)-methyltransferase 1